MKFRYSLLIFLPVLLFLACEKHVDQPAPEDNRLDTPFCNDPDAVNFNWDFPGTPDSTVCFYPSDVFTGTYLFNDTVFYEDYDTAYIKPETLTVFALSKTKLALLGFCGPNDTIAFTAQKSLTAYTDTLFEKGQYMCRQQDTVSGTLKKTLGDTVRLQINFTVYSDTGLNYHIGTAIKL